MSKKSKIPDNLPAVPAGHVLLTDPKIPIACGDKIISTIASEAESCNKWTDLDEEEWGGYTVGAAHRLRCLICRPLPCPEPTPAAKRLKSAKARREKTFLRKVHKQMKETKQQLVRRVYRVTRVFTQTALVEAYSIQGAVDRAVMNPEDYTWTRVEADYEAQSGE